MKLWWPNVALPYTNHANESRGANVQSLALRLAYENSIGILLIQEPWTLRNLSAKCSKLYPNLTTFSPLRIGMLAQGHHNLKFEKTTTGNVAK